ncbi:MAG: rhamnulokinase [Candidatus Brocadiia bacterium]|nr:MAG: rhamnulokinase [Candidatus Brocadiia bacterium]
MDVGAESGRVMLVTLADNKLEIREMHRFPNGPVQEEGTLRWDFEKLFGDIKTGLKKTFSVQRDIVSIGVDTWGVDFGLLDAKGKLIENPYHYRDSRNNDMIEKACQIMPQEQIYMNSGIQFLQFNSLYQLLACKQQKPEILAKARTLLFMPNLIMYYLTGRKYAEFTIASTSQMMDMRTGRWSDALLDTMELPKNILPEVIKPGGKAGVLKKALAEELGAGQIDVMAVGTHDTASAVAGVPASGDRDWSYLSSGTWSLMGIEAADAIINRDSFKLLVTNEGGVENTFRVLKNIMGLWLVQQCRSHWASQGDELDYSVLTQLASQSRPLQGYIDPDYKEFLGPGQMPDKINAYLKMTGRKEIDDKGQMIRVILESLAARYHQVLRALEKLSGSTIEILHIVGGGGQNELHNQMTADATGKKVVSGPIEATVLGNAVVQAIGSGQIDSLQAGRKIIGNSFALKEYSPRKTARWQKYIDNFPPLENAD